MSVLNFTDSNVMIRRIFGRGRDAIQAERSFSQPAWAKTQEAHPSLERLRGLEAGWNGGKAPAPTAIALETARTICDAFARENRPFDRIAASAVGGVGLTMQGRRRRLYIEIRNSGDVYVLQSSPNAEPDVYSAPVGSSRDMTTLVATARAFLDE